MQTLHASPSVLKKILRTKSEIQSTKSEIDVNKQIKHIGWDSQNF